MERSEHIGDLIAALAKAQAEFTPALKENEAKIKGTSKQGAAYEYGYKYADLAANISAVRPALNKHGIALMHFNESDLERQVASVSCSLHLGEQFISMSVEAPAMGQNGFNVQSLGAAWTYLRRYTLQALCGLATEDDDGASVATSNAPIPKKQAWKGNREKEAEQPVANYAEDAQPDKVYVPKTGPSAEEINGWLTAFAEAATLEEFNEHIVPLAKERGREFVLMMAGEAKKRGYAPDRATGLYIERKAS
jgi:hypothetical protein